VEPIAASSRRWLGPALAMGASAVLLGVLIWPRGEAAPMPPAAAAPAMPSAAAPQNAEGAAEPEAPKALATELAKVVTPEPALVTIQVTTTPPGASLQLEGGRKLCATTPCSFETTRGSLVSVQARRGQQRATATLTPAADADVHLVLRAAPRARAGSAPSASASEAPPDLKIPDHYR
jgi:hypothetical protein